MDLRLDQFKMGDVLRLVGEIEELPIEKVWLSQQGGYRWVDYETRSRKTQRRVVISVEYDDGDWEAVVYDSFPSAAEIPNVATLPSTLRWAGATFEREERGRCTTELISHGDPPVECQYADYYDDEDRAIAVEVFGGGQPDETEVEVFVGRTIRPTDIELYLPVDTEPRPRLTATKGAQPAAAAGGGTVTMSSRQLIIGFVVLAVIFLLIVMAVAS